MKGDHRKTEAATRFDFRKHIVKSTDEFEKDKHYTVLCKRAGKSDTIGNDIRYNLNNLKIPFEWQGYLRVLNYKE